MIFFKPTTTASSLLFIISSIILACCTAGHSGKLILLSNNNNIQCKVNSSCKSASFNAQQVEAAYKNKIAAEAEDACKQLKLKQTTDTSKATYRVHHTDFIVYERCADKNTPATLSLSYVVTFENINSKALSSFKADTNIVQELSLTQPNALAQKKPDFTPYLHNLSHKAYLLAKKGLRSLK